MKTKASCFVSPPMEVLEDVLFFGAISVVVTVG